MRYRRACKVSDRVDGALHRKQSSPTRTCFCVHLLTGGTSCYNTSTPPLRPHHGRKSSSKLDRQNSGYTSHHITSHHARRRTSQAFRLLFYAARPEHGLRGFSCAGGSFLRAGCPRRTEKARSSTSLRLWRSLRRSEVCHSPHVHGSLTPFVTRITPARHRKQASSNNAVDEAREGRVINSSPGPMSTIGAGVRGIIADPIS